MATPSTLIKFFFVRVWEGRALYRTPISPFARYNGLRAALMQVAASLHSPL